jgi:catechol 2,3-dioxygenase-like lactoylglutathione lyase family enzyme
MYEAFVFPDFSVFRIFFSRSLEHGPAARIATLRDEVTPMPAPPVQKLVHFALVTGDIAQTQRWYADVLGAEIPEPEPGFPPRVLFAGTSIDLFPSGGTSPAGLPFGLPAPGGIGQHHAFVIALDDFDRWTQHLESMGQSYRCAAHGMRFMSIYLDDPEGYHIELTVPFDDEALGQQEIEERGLVPRYVNSKVS